MATTPERDAELLAVGQQCSHSTCHLVDFLPFKCHHCQDSFCQEHFKVDDHKCPKYDESQHNRVAPNCPLCNIPIAFRQGQDPNVRMDQHVETECSVTTGRIKSKSTPVCARPTCKKVLFSPIRCDKCRQQFCPAHRFPGDHTCAPLASSSTAQSNLYSRFEATSKGLAAKASAAASSTAKRPSATAKPIAKASSAPASSSSSNSGTKLPFTKMKTNSLSPLASPLEPLTASFSTIASDTDVQPPTRSPSPDNKPAFMLDFLSFVPRPLFASA